MYAQENLRADHKETERHAIALGLQQKQSIRAIARALGRSPSTISREIHRNAGGNGDVSRFAQQRWHKRRIHSRPQPKLHRQGALFARVCEYLRRHCSPQQIAGRLKKLHPADRRQQVSHESIDTCIDAQPRGELKKELISCLRMAHAKRWPRSRDNDRRGPIQHLPSIHVRPPEVNNRQLAGHWEEDLIKGADLSGYSQQQLDAVADELNGRPRKTLGCCTPLEVYTQHLQRLKRLPDSVH